jgi:hypothetical protein
MKKIAIAVLLSGCFLGAACSPKEEAPKGPITPSATMKPATDPALTNAELRPDRKKADVATAIVPMTEPMATPDAPWPTPSP